MCNQQTAINLLADHLLMLVQPLIHTGHFYQIFHRQVFFLEEIILAHFGARPILEKKI
jgi:hypothetical protein